ncbi:ABC transporter substrate-binding protein [Nonomuraea typhae]|uniref:ABC transporter substrate-binding protein n=1 Tax=Nonomuraea typhae TaxID=2603600 RepID=A0ABW7Z163_9ACTN
MRRPSPLSRERDLPILVFTGAADAAVETVVHFHRRVPHAEVDGDALPDVPAIVDRLAGVQGMFSTWVRGTLLPPPRFPLTQFVLWAWEQRLKQASPNPVAKRQEFREALARWRKERSRSNRVRRSMADYLGRALTTWIPVSGLAAYGLQQLVDGLSLLLWGAGAAVALIGGLVHALLLIRGPIFYRWFRKAPYLRRRRDESVIEYAVRIAESPADLVERLLVTAFLEDLRQAYQRRVIPWPGWGRNTYPLLQLRRAEPGTPGRRFLELLNSVKSRTGQRGPLLVVASTRVPPTGHHHALVAGDEAELVDLLHAWQLAARQVKPSAYIVADAVPPDPNAPKDRPSRLLPVRPLLYWLVVLALLVLPLSGAVWATAGCGPELTRVAEQCVGFGPLDRMGAHPRVKAVLDRIERQNAAIPFGAEVLTIVYLGPLTTQPDARRKDGQMTAVAGELAGIGALQDSYNERKDRKLRVAFANAGQDFLSAELAAEGVAQRARSDRTIAAVVGLAWSREEVRLAVQRLTRANLPMVSTVTSGETIAGLGKERSAYLFRLAVTNVRQVVATVHWLKTLGLNAEVGKAPKVAVVWQKEPNDLYSEELKTLFRERYPDSTDHVFTDDGDLGPAMAQACSPEEGPKVVYYTGRSEFLSALKRAWGGSCQKAKIPLVASDDITGEIVNEVQPDPSRHTVTMSFVGLSDVRRGLGDNQARSDLERWGKDLAYSAAHASFGYDAAYAVAQAVDAAQPHVGEFRTAVHYNLRGLSFDGATGLVRFSSHATEHDAQDRDVWLMSVEEGKEIEVHHVCHPNTVTGNCGPPPKQ